MIHVAILPCGVHDFASCWADAVAMVAKATGHTEAELWYQERRPGVLVVCWGRPSGAGGIVGTIMDYDAYNRAKIRGELPQ